MSVSKAGEGVISNINEIIRVSLMELGIDQQEAETSANNASQKVKQVFAGCMVYIRKDSSLELLERDKKILKDFTGKNQIELSRKYGLTVQRIYMILKKNHEDSL